MLQQTQVNTVIPYYLRFMERFPTLDDLAAAELDEVLHYWTGLGYYARGRNIHKAAQIINTEFAGQLPREHEQLQQLPGIGRSTASAILSFACNQHHAILDGNVKRVLSRYFLVDGWSGHANTNKQLWYHAEQVTPEQRCADFNQAIMDLGSSLCSRSKPRCTLCPLKSTCSAYRENKTHLYPASKPGKKLPEKKTFFLMLTNSDSEVLLEKRPAQGLWGGLWSFPQVGSITEIDDWLTYAHCSSAAEFVHWPSFKHSFSHYHLNIHPVHIQISEQLQIMDSNVYLWYKTTRDDLKLGMPAPIKLLLDKINH